MQPKKVLSNKRIFSSELKAGYLAGFFYAASRSEATLPEELPANLGKESVSKFNKKRQQVFKSRVSQMWVKENDQ